MPPSQRPRQPWWMWLFFFLRAPEAMDALQWRLLGVLGTTVLVNHYDFALLSLALPEIQDGLGVAEEDVGPWPAPSAPAPCPPCCSACSPIARAAAACCCSPSSASRPAPRSRPSPRMRGASSGSSSPRAPS